MSSDEDIDLSMKKKKKKKAVKKRIVDSDDEGSDDGPSERPEKAPAAAAPGAAKAAMDADYDTDNEDLEVFYAMLKNPKYRKGRKKTEAVAADAQVDWDAMQDTDRDYTYAEILSRLYDRLKSTNASLGVKQVHKIRPPNVVRDGTKKVAFTNFAEICKSLNRTQEHVFQYTLTELGTSGNIDGNNCLILKGRLNAKHIENLLRKYIDTYVTCEMCHSTDTKLQKDPGSRLTTLQCNQCNASRTVASITGGFSAQIGKRRRMKK